MFLNKKAITELVGFILLTLIIVIASGTAYIFSKSYLEDNIRNLDFNSMKITLTELNYKINEIKSFDESQFSIPIFFKYGNLEIDGNKLKYNSEVQLNINPDFCKNNLCLGSRNGYGIYYLNLTNGYNFSSNFSLTPGKYVISFKNLMNDSKIMVSIK